MSELFGRCGRAVDGTYWCFDPPGAPIRNAALDGVLDESIGGGFLSGFLGSEPTTFDCAVMPDHEVACEGSDANAQLGFPISSADQCQYDCTGISLSPKRVSCPYPCENELRVVPGVGPSSAVIGIGGPCALQLDGKVSCWGADGSGNVVAPHTIALPDRATAIAGGEGSCAILGSGQLACWALGSDGPIDPNTCPSTSCVLPAVVPGLSHLVAVSITYDHGCVVRNDGAAFCWGQNIAGELGDGTGKATAAPVRVATALRFSKISAGLVATCAVTQNAHVACWGFADAPAGVNGATACPGGLPGGCRLVPVEIPGVENVEQVSAIDSGPLAYALLTDGTVSSIDDDPNGGFVVKQLAP